MTSLILVHLFSLCAVFLLGIKAGVWLYERNEKEIERINEHIDELHES